MIVVDASALTNAVIDDDVIGDRCRAELDRDPHWTAPAHLIVEVFSSIRGRFLGNKLSEQRALDALDAIASATIDVIDTGPLLARMWELRRNLSGYDAAYVAAAEIHGGTLITSDRRLARAPGIRCEVRLAVPEDSG